VKGELIIDKPPSGAPFILGAFLNNLCRGPLHHVTYHISRLWILTRRFEKKIKKPPDVALFCPRNII
jgi:hypothetical protein